MNSLKKLLILLVLFLYIQPVFPQEQEQDKSVLTLNRLFKSPEFFGDRFGPVRFLDNGQGYTSLEKSEAVKGTRDIIKYDTESGDREILVSASLLIPEGDTTALSIANYEWSPDKNMLLIFTNTARVWRYNTKGDYWVLNLESKKLMKLGGDAPESSLMFAKFSPDNKKVAYVSKHNVFAQDLSDGKITQLTFDGSNTTINGTFDWVYEEELDDRDGFRWSPDSKKIAYWQLDATGIGEFLMINTTDSIYSFTIPVQYPKVGTTNSAAKVGVVSADGGKTTWMKVPGDPRNNYIARMDWTGNSDEIYVQHLNRLQNKLDILLCDIKTGDVKTVLTENAEAWIDINDDMHWFNDGKSFTWVSERDGWRHVYEVSRDGKDVKLLTPGDFDVIEIETIDFDNRWIYYIASPDNPTQRYLYRVSLDGKGTIEQITPEVLKGTNSYQVSDGSNYAIHSYSNINTPNTTDLVELPSHKVVRNLVANEKLKETIAAINMLPIEFFKVDIGNNVKLDGWMVKPPDFDPSKKYPVLYYLYGHPAAQTVLDRWSGSQMLWYVMLAQKGYIVMSVDNRGTPAPRGRDFRKYIYKNVGGLSSKDQAEAMKGIIKKFSFVDPLRVGVWGWSGGAVSTLNLMFRYPEIFKTGIAVAPVTDERLYDTIYSERYMGLPADNADGYKESAPLTYAHQLEGNLLVVHGTGDDNVHYQNTERLINELVKYNKQFSMMAYPNRSHGIYEGSGTRMHLFTLLTNYLYTNLPAGAN
ncbi:MAG TPA: S9 family peptidase [Ignavibacteriaceae bacterium]|nr:S9 family peptidase [Ignavibacteriaceae bacterium]